MDNQFAGLIISIFAIAVSALSIIISCHANWLGEKSEYYRNPKIRIVLSDYHLEGYVEFGLEQYKKKYYLSRTKWRKLTSGASHKDNKNSLIVSCVNSWKKTYPTAEVINKSTFYKLPD